ncbi:unnamed protein product [Ceratitis capitata]|uniref:(Mediterranean fruit fly) hypothetical protein n=1 Tax=Ceratitis capitata TaxID=7213 RepID=A0A811U1U3_CERCA|nr:unnamed protein product [Ceratitis capitata]
MNTYKNTTMNDDKSKQASKQTNKQTGHPISAARKRANALISVLTFHFSSERECEFSRALHKTYLLICFQTVKNVRSLHYQNVVSFLNVSFLQGAYHYIQTYIHTYTYM